MKDHQITLEEGQRQMVLLALAKLSIERPGWLDAAEKLALKMDNHTAQGKPELLYQFRRIHADGPEESGHTLLEAASHALRSYQYGNSATALAKEMADAIDLELGPDKLAPIAHLIAGIRRYADQHIETGSFLRSFLENDLSRACLQADPATLQQFGGIFLYLSTQIPRESWGTPERVSEWLARRPTP